MNIEQDSHILQQEEGESQLALSYSSNSHLSNILDRHSNLMQTLTRASQIDIEVI